VATGEAAQVRTPSAPTALCFSYAGVGFGHGDAQAPPVQYENHQWVGITTIVDRAIGTVAVATTSRSSWCSS
jgi:hypothetical protein